MSFAYNKNFAWTFAFELFSLQFSYFRLKSSSGDFYNSDFYNRDFCFWFRGNACFQVHSSKETPQSNCREVKIENSSPVQRWGRPPGSCRAARIEWGGECWRPRSRPGRVACRTPGSSPGHGTGSAPGSTGVGTPPENGINPGYVRTCRAIKYHRIVSVGRFYKYIQSLN